MTGSNQHLEAIQDIRQIMERSSRFISLSGWSGIAAGVCALVGAHFANEVIQAHKASRNAGIDTYAEDGFGVFDSPMAGQLLLIAILTFIAALIAAFIFTYTRSKKEGIAIWGKSSRRLIFNVAMPMAVGGLFILKLIEMGVVGLIPPACLIFYGLALVNASKFTLGEIRYLGYMQVILGLLNCWFIGYGIYFWAIGFGIMHIIYGTLMLWKYERK